MPVLTGIIGVKDEVRAVTARDSNGPGAIVSENGIVIRTVIAVVIDMMTTAAPPVAVISFVVVGNALARALDLAPLTTTLITGLQVVPAETRVNGVTVVAVVNNILDVDLLVPDVAIIHLASHHSLKMNEIDVPFLYSNLPRA